MTPERIRHLVTHPAIRAGAQIVLSGVLVASIWLPPQRPWAIAFAFVPLIVAWLRATRWQEVLVTGVLCQWIISGIAFAWIAPSVRTYHDVSEPVAIACWLLAAAVTNLHIPLIGVAWWSLVRRYSLGPWRASGLLALAWVGLAQLYPTFVPFDYGYPWLWSGVPILNLADIVGFRGLAGVTLLVNALLAFAWCAPARRERIRLAAVAACTLLALSGLGALHARQWEAGERSLRIALIQPNFSRADTMRALGDMQVDASRVQELLRASAEQQAKSPSNLWIWPESAILTSLAGASLGYDQWLSSMLATPAVPILTGVHWTAGPSAVHNSAALFDRRGGLTSLYHKEQLFPFGEYIPLLGRLVERAGAHYSPAQKEQTGVLTIDGVRLGVTICFEGLFPSLFRTRADQGAQIFVNLTNDQPFGNTGERHQHLYMAMARAIELRRPLVRVALSGASTVITRTGEVIAYGGMEQAWSETVSVPYVQDPPPTLFQRYGHWVEHLCLLAAAAILLGLEWALRRDRKHEQSKTSAKSRRVAAESWVQRAKRAALTSRGRLPVARLVRLGIVLIGVSQALGYWTGWSGLRNVGLLSGASPLPIVFGATNGYEFWAEQHALDLELAGGERRRVVMSQHVFSNLPGPHRMHMVLSLPFMAAPIAPRALWSGALERGLCANGPLSRAMALDATVEAGVLEITTRAGRTWREPFVCRR